MIRFILKGILRDSTRSKFPILIVAIGVLFTVFMVAFLGGVFDDMIDLNARFSTGHVKVMTVGFSENQAQKPLDLAILDLDSLTAHLERQYPKMIWVPRIHFGGLIDLADEDGETRGQGPAVGQALDLFSENNSDIERLNIASALRSGSVPKSAGDALISEEFADKTGLSVGDEITFFGSTMYGSMSCQNFKVSGTISFGNPSLDRGGFIIDISDARQMLDMENGATELLGYFDGNIYDDELAEKITKEFNATYSDSDDEFSPIMVTLKQQNDLASLLDYAAYMQQIMVIVFIAAMSIVLWNVGLLGGLRRYKEFGVRLALGESKSAIFKNMLIEAFLIGLIGSFLGTLISLVILIPLSIYGIDISGLLPDMTLMMPSTLRTVIMPSIFYLGFIPGLGAMLLGQTLAGIGIFKRETSRLFKELEV